MIRAIALVLAAPSAAAPQAADTLILGGQQVVVQSWQWGARGNGHSMLGASDREPLLLKGHFPGCTRGARYAGAQFVAAGKMAELAEVTVVDCSSDGMTLKARKVTVKGWNPETKEL